MRMHLAARLRKRQYLGRRLQRVERLEPRLTLSVTPGLELVVDYDDGSLESDDELTSLIGVDSPGLASTPYQNPLNPFDTNASFSVEPADVLFLINGLNDQQTLDAMAHGIDYRRFPDPTGDGKLAPLDVLQVINCLNNPEGGCTTVSVDDGLEPQPLMVDQVTRVDRQYPDQIIEAGAAVIASGSYHGYLTGGGATTEVHHQTAHYVDTESPTLQIWGSQSVAESVFAVSGWGHIELDLTVVSNIFDKFECCTGNDQPWTEIRAEGAETSLAVTATGNFSIIVTTSAADTIVGSGDYVVDAGAFTGILNNQRDSAAVTIEITGSV
ncbi:hypothetical protein CL628_03380, partial [bacterium]|nr:hypothetical protein [bacterium]